MALTGSETIAAIREQTDTVLLGFSCGKDSIACWLECRKHFPRIVPFYMYLVPDLEFIEGSLRFYERWFGTPILRVPHPSLYRMWNHCVFQPPQNRGIIQAANLASLDYLDLHNLIREQVGLPDSAYCATGVRAVDSPYRLISIKRNGPIHHRKRQFFPIWDWHKARLLEEITAAKIPLPVDYRLFGRSFDGIDYRFLAPIKQRFPRDYARILEYYPMADLELFRREHAHVG